MAYQIIPYSIIHADDWNQFIKRSRNSTFLFDREFMDYHADRFRDHSVMVYSDNGKLAACFPANQKDSIIYAHQGLTYGGLIQGNDDKLETTMSIWRSILDYYASQSIEKIAYKHFPSFLNTLPIQDTEYTLFLLNADLYRRDTAFVIDYDIPQKIAGNYRREAQKALAAGYHSRFTKDHVKFWDQLLIPNLEKRFGVAPVHSIEDISLLVDRFPKEINLYGVYSPDDELVGGTVLFDCGHVRHCQYIASTERARRSGALNAMFVNLINLSSEHFRLFDFGIANEKDGRVLNKGLANWKQRMGGRAMTHDFYMIRTANRHLLSAH